MIETSVVETIAARIERELARVRAARPALASRISRAEGIVVTHLSRRVVLRIEQCRPLVSPVRGDRPDVIIRFAKTALSEENQMSIFPTKILLAIDGSSEGELATRTAVDLGQNTDSELHVIHVVDVDSIAAFYPGATDPGGVEMPDPILVEDVQRGAEQRGREMLDEEVQRISSAGGTVAQAHLAMGEAAREVVHLAEDLGAGLIVLGSRGHGGIRRALIGSVSDSVVRHAHCPVLVVRH